MALLMMQNAGAVTRPGTVISNTANAAFTFDGANLDSPSNAADVTVTEGSTPSQVRFFQYSPSGQGAVAKTAGPTGCRVGDAGEPFTPLANPTYPGGEVLDAAGSLNLVAARRFHQGEPIFVELTDLDQNLDASARDITQVT